MLATLLLVATAQAATAAPDRVSLRPVDRRLELELNPAARTWSGSLLATLEVLESGRRFALLLSGSAVSRVELTDRRGRVELSWGAGEDGALLVEAARPVAPGRASLNVAFDGEWARVSPGVARDSAGTRAWLERGERIAFPAWPEAAATRWTLLVHAPRGFEVRASGRRAGIDDTRDWRTWTFRTARPMPGDSLRVAVRPRTASAGAARAVRPDR